MPKVAHNRPSFDWMRNEFMEAIKSSMKKGDVEPIQNVFDSLQQLETDKRSALDQGFRDYLILLLEKPQETVVWETFVTRCIETCRHELSTVTIPVVLLGDIFDALTLDKCEQLFTFVENGVSIWKEELFFAACKNNLLRMCNDLLRKLSKSQNTVFCGRILLFLAKFFPFSERSGLNIVSEFNLENVTEFSEDEGKETDEKMDESTTDGGTEKIKVDYNLYSKFWALQNFFRNPLLVYNKAQWKTFVSHTEIVLSTFKGMKLEEVHSKSPIPVNRVSSSYSGNVNYFAKFLTNQRLLELQLSDVKFRRYVLVQFLELFQYLNATVKFKNDNQELKVQEAEWVKETTDQVYRLLKETPPDGEYFCKAVEHTLKREEFWNNWKNDGCPELQKPNAIQDDNNEEDKKQTAKLPKRPRKRVGELIKDAEGHKKFNLGNPDLTKLWNFTPDNLEACRAPERNFLMSLEDYFKDVIEQLDPASQVEEQYKIVKDGNFGWRALRLLALQFSHFFTHNNNQITKLPEYLESMIRKIAKERPIIVPTGEDRPESLEEQTNAEIVTETENMERMEGEGVEEDELLNSDEKKDKNSKEITIVDTPETMPTGPTIRIDILNAVAPNISAQWKTLAEKLGLKDTIEYIEESLPSDLERARYVLQLWTEEDSNRYPEDLAFALEQAGFPSAAEIVKTFLF